MPTPELRQTVDVGDIDVYETLRPTVALPNDPTVRLGSRSFLRLTQTPGGAAGIAATWDGGMAEVSTFGAGAEWLGERVDRLLGVDDGVSGFDPKHETLRTLWRSRQGDRVGGTSTVWHDLAWFILQQRVASIDAAEHWARLVENLGEPVELPAGVEVPSGRWNQKVLMAPPSADTVLATSPSELHALGIEGQRARNLRAAAEHARKLEGLIDRPAGDALSALQSISGIGPWTASCLAAMTWGDPDAVIIGDYGIPSMISWLLAGEREADDARMLELLQPYRPHRYRVLKLIMASGQHPPRRAPRARRIDIRRL